MKYPISKMKVDEVRNECMVRLGVSSREELATALQTIASNMPDIDEENNLVESRTVRKILKRLRDRNVHVPVSKDAE